MATERRYDMAADGNAVSPFLDKNFYGEMSCETGITPTRIKDIALQYRGVDVKIEGKRGTSYIDEKMKLNNINDPPRNISFELSSLQGVNVREGWFTKEDSMTTHYLIGCIFSRNTDKRTLKTEQIDHITVSLISKAELYAYLGKYGITKETLRDFAQKFKRTQDIVSMHIERGRIQHISMREGFDGAWYTFSPWLTEQPLNLVMPFRDLNLLPHTKRYCVSQGGYVEIGYPTSEDVLTARLIEMERRLGDFEERLSKLEGEDTASVI